MSLDAGGIYRRRFNYRARRRSVVTFSHAIVSAPADYGVGQYGIDYYHATTADIVPTGNLTLGGQTAAANATGTSPAGALTIAGQTPVAGAKGTSPAGALTIAGQVPVANANATAPTGAI